MIKPVISAPGRWFNNIADLLEKRPFHATTVLLFCAFVGTSRVFMEWMGGRAPLFVAADIVGFTIFYWMCFFVYGFVVGVLVRDRWRQRINVILVGIFCGLLPPIIDLLWYGIGNFRYSYLWEFPQAWRWQIYNPAFRIPLGEAVVLWFTVLLVALYVRLRTQSLWHMLLGAGLAYLGVNFVGGGITVLARAEAAALGLTRHGALYYFLLSSEVLVTLVVYLSMRRDVTRHLLPRLLHALPFVAICLCGSALAGGITPVSWWAAGLLLILIATSVVQNDFYDRKEDALQQRPAYADENDVRFFTIISAMLVVVLAVSTSAMAMPAMIFWIVSILYSFPLYRGKDFFPANLKMEGVVATCAFLLGAIATWEYTAARGGMFNIFGNVWHGRDHMWGVTPQVVTASALVFGGWSVIAALKDYKDLDADAAAGVQTIYTLSRKRGGDPQRLHQRMSVVCGVFMALPLPLLYAGGLVRANWVIAGAVAGLLMFRLALAVGTYRGFRRFLAATTVYLAALAVLVERAVFLPN